MKNAYLLIRRDMHRLDWYAIVSALLTPAGCDHFQTMQIPPRPAFFPGRHFPATMIAFVEKYNTGGVQREVTNVMRAGPDGGVEFIRNL